jgi:glycosyltransferase involved in cell wall biosynthesis
LSWVKARMQYLAVLPAHILNRFVAWLFASRNPAVVYIREFIRRNDFLRLGARSFIRSVRDLPDLVQKIEIMLKGPAHRRLQAIITARALGGAVSTSELERIWHECRGNKRVMYVADELEREQIEAILAATRVNAVCYNDLAIEAAESIQEEYDILVVGPLRDKDKRVEDLCGNYGAREKVLRVGVALTQSEYAKFKSDRERPKKSKPRGLVREILARGEPLSVVFLNDLGFQYGAGIALKRQVSSLLLQGWDVSVIAWTPGNVVDPPNVTGVKYFEKWQGIHSVPSGGNERVDSEEVGAELIAQIQSLDPDVVITGNLHGAKWPLGVLSKLRSLGIQTVTYMHDTYFITGRCAQPLACTLYRTGCDTRCPTSNEYPRLAPDEIAPAWDAKGLIFTGSNRVPLVGNSRWTQNMVVQRFGTAAKTDFVNLGLDHELFAPIEKSTARRLLKIPDNKPLVIMGSVDIHDRWKGGSLFHGLFKALVDRNDVGVILFGRSSESLRCVKSFGVVHDPGLMPLILNTADIFVSTAIAESFGQTLLEASACAIPVVAFDVGGVSDVIVNNETGILVEKLSIEGLVAAVDRLIKNPIERQQMGHNGRLRVEEKFTLTQQAHGWIDCLKRIC